LIVLFGFFKTIEFIITSAMQQEKAEIRLIDCDSKF